MPCEATALFLHQQRIFHAANLLRYYSVAIGITSLFFIALTAWAEPAYATNSTPLLVLARCRGHNLHTVKKMQPMACIVTSTSHKIQNSIIFYRVLRNEAARESA